MARGRGQKYILPVDFAVSAGGMRVFDPSFHENSKGGSGLGGNLEIFGDTLVSMRAEEMISVHSNLQSMNDGGDGLAIPPVSSSVDVVPPLGCPNHGWLCLLITDSRRWVVNLSLCLILC